MTLGVSAIAFAILFSVPLGVAAAIPPTVLLMDCFILSVMGQALPSFWFALMLIILLSVNLRLLPTSGSDSWLHLLCQPWCLATTLRDHEVNAYWYARVLSTDYIRTARAKGLRPGVVLFKRVTQCNHSVVSCRCAVWVYIGGSFG